MRVLLVGSGGREHAIGWSLARSGALSELISLPGNPGLGDLGPVIEGVSATDVGAVAAVARVHAVDLVVVGPEAPLAAGVADAVSRLGIPVFGPSRAAARLESSKAFAKEVMLRAGVPTAGAWVFDERSAAESHVHGHPGPYVVKADGLAAGKGVLVTAERSEALVWIARCFEGGFGDAGSRVVIEEYLDGPELSVFAVCDGTDFLTLEPARDYKRALDGDAGPNTGGMGSYSPVELPDGLLETIDRTVVAPTLEQMAADGVPYRGFLYAGLALTVDGPRVIEYNCRLGDPETQVVLPRLRTDLTELLMAATRGELATMSLDWSPGSFVNVVLASEGYPESPRTGDVISGLAGVDPETLVFHAGTRRDNGNLLTSGGRVLNVVGRGSTLENARQSAYAAVDRISWKGMQYRTDIAETPGS